MIDAYAEVPGRGRPDPPAGFGDRVAMAYGGGMETLVGHGSVATPGAFAGLGEASRHFGSIAWSETVLPAIEATRDGFPLSPTAAAYLTFFVAEHFLHVSGVLGLVSLGLMMAGVGRTGIILMILRKACFCLS